MEWNKEPSPRGEGSLFFIHCSINIMRIEVDGIKISRIWLYILPVVLWVALIFHFSSQSFQEQTIQPFLQRHFNENKLREILPDITIHFNHRAISAKLAPFDFIEFIFRKSAHLFIYGMLALVFYITSKPLRLRMAYRVVWALTAVTVVASIDEWNQLSSFQRTGTPRDVIVDLAGGAICLVIGLSIGRGLSRIRAKLKRS
ncbi:VanZ family protein [Paenibacillus taihuensis]|uniref:VanZ family protein n=1 Tax=Paenibacillus taihuensis TaxID=1156355 RepID=A0A3D9Q451_9BACL|nr:VanZ family protein [Paenibacillus taihuensis]